MQRAAACNRGIGERQLIPAQLPDDACSQGGVVVVADRSRRKAGNSERLHGAVSRQVLRCLHRALCGLCAAMPEVYAASMYWTGLDSRVSRHPDEQVC